MSIATYLEELRDSSIDVTSKGLMQLSGLMDEEADEFRAVWAQISTPRRTEILARLVDLAEQNVEMDFYMVFFHAIKDEHPGVRERAISGLWESDDRRTIPLLVERLRNDPEPSVRAASAMVLGHFAQLAEAGKLIARDCTRVFDALMESLRNDNEPLEVRRRALESVAPFQSDEVQEWVRWGYANDDPLLRQSSMFAMGRASDDRWLSQVQDEMSSHDPAMRYEAVNAARELASEEAVPQLAELVLDSDRQVAMAALHALAAIGGTNAKKVLRGFAAMSSDDAVREAAEESLRQLQSDEADFSTFEVDRLDGQS